MDLLSTSVNQADIQLEDFSQQDQDPPASLARSVGLLQTQLLSLVYAYQDAHMKFPLFDVDALFKACSNMLDFFFNYHKMF